MTTAGATAGWVRVVVTSVVAAVLVGSVLAVLPGWWGSVRPPPPTPVDGARVAAAGVALAGLRVTEPLPLEGYDRAFFGDPWADVDGNGCDTRNDVLAAWLEDVEHDPGQPCLVVTGTLHDPYSGHVVTFRRGPQTSSEIQVDHVVALADAWRKGAADWPPPLALAFANDRGNLVPTLGHLNSAKGADDAATWLPPAAGFRCAYAVQQVLVKDTYDLGVTSEEAAALADTLGTCGDRRVAPGRPLSGAADNLAGPASTAWNPPRAPGRRSGRRARCSFWTASSSARRPTSRSRWTASSRCCGGSTRSAGWRSRWRSRTSSAIAPPRSGSSTRSGC